MDRKKVNKMASETTHDEVLDDICGIMVELVDGGSITSHDLDDLHYLLLIENILRPMSNDRLH